MGIMTIEQDRTRFTREISYLETLIAELQGPIIEYDKMIADIQNQIKTLQYDIQARGDVLESLAAINTISAVELKNRIQAGMAEITSNKQSNQAGLEENLKAKEAVISMDQPIIRAISIRIKELKDAVGFNDWI